MEGSSKKLTEETIESELEVRRCVASHDDQQKNVCRVGQLHMSTPTQALNRTCVSSVKQVLPAVEGL